MTLSKKPAWEASFFGFPIEEVKIGKSELSVDEVTAQLAELVAGVVPRSRKNPIHPATRTFQALRIAVNGELDALELALRDFPNLLKPGGRFAIISFHSLEDRLVKHAFRDNPRLKVTHRKPILPTDAEIAANPRSRSSRLRVAIRLDDGDIEKQPFIYAPKRSELHR